MAAAQWYQLVPVKHTRLFATADRSASKTSSSITAANNSSDPEPSLGHLYLGWQYKHWAISHPCCSSLGAQKPPTQLLQRIGQRGRRDAMPGRTIVNRHPRPLLSSGVGGDGCAARVSPRAAISMLPGHPAAQLLAFTLDAGVQSRRPIDAQALPRQPKRALVRSEGRAKRQASRHASLYTWLSGAGPSRASCWSAFLHSFPDQLA